MFPSSGLSDGGCIRGLFRSSHEPPILRVNPGVSQSDPGIEAGEGWPDLGSQERECGFENLKAANDKLAADVEVLKKTVAAMQEKENSGVRTVALKQ